MPGRGNGHANTLAPRARILAINFAKSGCFSAKRARRRVRPVLPRPKVLPRGAYGHGYTRTMIPADHGLRARPACTATPLNDPIPLIFSTPVCRKGDFARRGQSD